MYRLANLCDSFPYGSDFSFGFRAVRGAPAQEEKMTLISTNPREASDGGGDSRIPARTKVSFFSSLGIKILKRDPAATKSTTAACLPARLKNGRNWDALEPDWKSAAYHILVSKRSDTTAGASSSGGRTYF